MRDAPGLGVVSCMPGAVAFLRHGTRDMLEPTLCCVVGEPPLTKKASVRLLVSL